MSVHDHSEHRSHSSRGFLKSRAGLVLIGFLVIAGVLLFTEHRAHVLGALLFLPLLLCPLMHLFMHGGHGGHDGHAARGQSNPERTSP
jgi:Protein of unknown function (DUF2933)